MMILYVLDIYSKAKNVTFTFFTQKFRYSFKKEMMKIYSIVILYYICNCNACQKYNIDKRSNKKEGRDSNNAQFLFYLIQLVKRCLWYLIDGIVINSYFIPGFLLLFSLMYICTAKFIYAFFLAFVILSSSFVIFLSFVSLEFHYLINIRIINN